MSIDIRVNRRLANRVEKATEGAGEAVRGARSLFAPSMPLALAGRALSRIKARARRHDLVGEVAYRDLELAHQGLKTAVDRLGDLEGAVRPPFRPGATRRVAKTRPATTRRTTAKTTKPATRDRGTTRRPEPSTAPA